MDFDEYEYLEKTVDEPKNNKDEKSEKEKIEKGYRRRERDEEDDGAADDDEDRVEERRSKRSRGHEESGMFINFNDSICKFVSVIINLGKFQFTHV